MKKAPEKGLFYDVTHCKIIFLPQQNVSKCGENYPKYVSEYVSKFPFRHTWGGVFFVSKDHL